MLMLACRVILLLSSCKEGIEPRLLTVAERSEFRATARYDEVMALCKALDESSDKIALGQMGTTVEGRAIPLLILADPPIKTAEEARRSDKLTVFAFGNIHAGEVCGKEALPMLAREIAAASKPPLLDKLIIVLAPIFNCDGNEHVSKNNRPGQLGPEEGMGQRHNAQDLDLNRDFVKLESPEVRALAKFMTDWDPAMVIDTHTTNGSHHQYTMTYEGPRHCAGDPRIVSFVREKMLPEVTLRLEGSTGYKSFFYGNLYDHGATWSTDYGDTPRYSTNYVGMRNRLAVLSEAYAYAPYKDRVLCTREFVRTLFDYAAEHADEIRKLIKDVDNETVARGKSPGPEDVIPLRTDIVPYEGKFRVAAYVEKEVNGRLTATDEKQDYEATFIGQSKPKLTVRRPFAYLLPASMRAVVEKLQQHGVQVEALHEDIPLPTQVYRVEGVHRAAQPFMKHVAVEAVDVSSRDERAKVSAGTVLVRMAQPLGTLAAYLLEPQSADGLATWNFFDEQLADGKDFPVQRLMSPVLVESGPLAALPSAEAVAQPITWDNYVAGRVPNLRGAPMSTLGWTDDGDHYLQVRDGKLCKVNAMTGESQPFHDFEKMAAALAKIEGLSEKQAKSMAEGSRFQMDKARKGSLFSKDNDLYFATFDGSLAMRLTKSPDLAEEMPELSPDGQRVAFVRSQNLYCVDVATQTEKQLTSDGGGLIFSGKCDWVYYEEIFNRNEKGFWWSKDSAALCFFRIDDAPVNTFTLIDHQPVRQRLEELRYPKAGDPNPHIRFGVVKADGASPPAFADLSAHDPNEIVISGAGFMPGEGAPAYFYLQNRQQTWLDFCTVPREGGAYKVLFRDQTQAWIESPGEPTFLKGGSFLLTSERTGWKHIYHYAADGKLLATVTSGEWEMRGIECVDEAGGWVYVMGTKDSPIADNLYRAKLDGSKLERLTQTSGHHETSVSPRGHLYIDSWSSHAAPTQVGLYRSDGTLERMLDTNPVEALKETKLAGYELFQIDMSDGFKLEAAMVKPVNFDASKKYPVWFTTYAGPHAPTIHDSWAGGHTHDQALANEGFIVFKTDPRSASGKGAVSTWAAYKKLGVSEMKDIEEAIAWLCTQPFVDAERIGMSGYSYGGFMTAYALTHSKRFKCGIAGGTVSDWALYDSIYTERFMDTPQNNPTGYAETSVITAAPNVHGKLLLVHGTLDDNVHMQNTIKLVDALVKADKDFELQLYPGFRHGVWGPHYQRTTMEFMKRNLMAPAAGAESSSAVGAKSEGGASAAP